MIVSEEAKHNHNAFTLVELLLALVVTGVILTAVITLASALGAANDSSSNIAQKQAQLRYATLRISELIKQCRLICGTPGNDMVIWKADYNDDGKINPGELVYIELGEERNRIRLLEFSPSSFSVGWFTNNSFTIQEIKSGQAKVELWIRCQEIYTNVFPQCGNAQFLLDTSAPQTRFVSISFELEEDGVMHEYQINASLRAWAGNLLDSSGEIISGDDD
jgi:prepilin-type N-terminal cleavage/methylation domain-containing protein